MQYSKISNEEGHLWDHNLVERWTTGILREIELEKGRVQAHRDTIKALKQRKDMANRCR